MMILVFSPLPFVDATSAWSFRERWKRAAVGAAGMIVELFIAALAMFVWAATGPGAAERRGLQHDLHRLGFHPAGQHQSAAALRRLLHPVRPRRSAQSQPARHAALAALDGKICFRLAQVRQPGGDRGARPSGSASMAQLSFVYRLFLFAGILLFVAGQWLLLGAVMAATGVVTWSIVPLGRLVHYLGSSPQIERVRRRATLTTLGAGAVVISSRLAVVPVPDTFTAPGRGARRELRVVFTESEGYFAELARGRREPSSSAVTCSCAMTNRELVWKSKAARAEEQRGAGPGAQRPELAGRGSRRGARTAGRGAPAHPAARAPAAAISRSARPRMASGWRRAPADLQGRWLPRGAAVGEIIDPRRALLFRGRAPGGCGESLWPEICAPPACACAAQAEKILRVTGATIIPAQQEVLPSAALGWLGGGEIAVKQTTAPAPAPRRPSSNCARRSIRTRPAGLLARAVRKTAVRAARRARCCPNGSPVLRQLLQRRFQA